MAEKSKEPFIKRQLKKIVINEKDFEKVVKIKEGVYNEVKTWSSLKLIFLNYYATIYTNVMKNDSRFKEKYYFINLFSGSGIDKVTDNGKNDLIFGSPLLVATQNKFIKMFFCDYNTKFCEALHERLKDIDIPEDNFSIYQEDCNSSIDKIIPQVKDGHSLIFIDPYGMEISWNSIEKILNLDADIIMNFQTVNIPRSNSRGRVCSPMQKFFKNATDVEMIYENPIAGETIGERLLELYKKGIRETKFKDFQRIVESVRIKKDEVFYYDLIFVTKRTSGDNPWLVPIIEAAKEIEKLDAKDVQGILDVLKGRQLTISGALEKFLSIKK